MAQQEILCSQIGHTRGFMLIENPKKSTRNGEFWQITGNVEPLFDQSLFATFTRSSNFRKKGGGRGIFQDFIEYTLGVAPLPVTVANKGL